jgi:hypothetical protein
MNNFIAPGVESKGQPTRFKSGVYRGVFYFTFTAGQSFTWTIQLPNSEKISVAVDERSEKLKLVQPLFDCKQQDKAILGWLNQNEFDIIIPIGSLNLFTPGASDRSQPNRFFIGLNKSAFSVPYESALSWKLPGYSLDLSQSVKECECSTTDNTQAKTQILSLAADFLAVAYEAAETLERASKDRVKALNREERGRLKELLQRSRERAVAEFKQIELTLISHIPKTSTACPQVLDGCRTVDDLPVIQSIRNRYYVIQSMINRLIARAGFITEQDTRRFKDIRKRAEISAKKAFESLNTIQRFRTVCGNSADVQVTAPADVPPKKRRKTSKKSAN